MGKGDQKYKPLESGNFNLSKYLMTVVEYIASSFISNIYLTKERLYNVLYNFLSVTFILDYKLLSYTICFFRV